MKPGQSLVVLLVFVSIAITLTSAATVVTLINSSTSSYIDQGQIAYNVAESGIENALLRLLRNPFYSGEMLTVGTGTATITVSGTNPISVVSLSQSGNFIRQITATAQFNNGILTVISWQETY